MSRLTFTGDPSVRRRLGALAGLLLALLAAGAWWRNVRVAAPLVATVHKGALTARLTTSGILRPIQSITYRSPLAGRESEIINLAPEGAHVKEGDLLARLDATELQRDLDRARQELRQATVELQVAHVERQEAEATVKAVSEGEGALTVDEARTRLQVAQRKAERLRQEYGQLKPLLDKGFITRDELKKTSDELEQADEELTLARKRTDVVVGLTHPRELQRATLQLAQKNSQVENMATRTQEAEIRLNLLLQQIESCAIYARRPGLVVYEDYLNAVPRRKIRVGDRVTSSQGIVTIPEVNRMMLEASVSEAEVHRVRPGQTAKVWAEAFPGVSLTGRVTRVGTLARASIDRPLDDKRFDLVIELDPATVDLRPEMTGRADVIVGTRADVLLLPINAVFEQHGELVAHVVRPSGSETRTVTLGESNDALVEIASGLREGDQVLLAAPPGGAAGAAGAPAQAAETPFYNRSSANALQPR